MIASKHIQFLLLCVGCVIAIYLGSNVVSIPFAGLMIILSTILILIWMLFAGVNWWVPLLSGVTISGTFYVGVKIYPSEAALALCVLGLIPVILAHDHSAFQYQRKRLPFIFYLLACYITIRLMIDVIPASGSRSSLARVLFGYCWGFGFIMIFQSYGSFVATRAAIRVMFILLLIRTAAAMVGFFANIPLYIPGINYVLSFSSKDSLIAMRSIAGTLLLCSLIFYHCAKSIFAKLLLLPVFFMTSLLVLMGAGRFQAFITFLLPIAFFAWSRNKVLLAGAVILGIAGLLVINLVPDSLLMLPPSAGRALSGLVFTSSTVTDTFGTGGSDQWHDAMHAEGFRRWTLSPVTVLFGDGITPSPDYSDAMSFERDKEVAVENAANLGAYESGLWNVLAVVGLVGFCLYAVFILIFLRTTLPYLLRKPKGTLWEAMVFWGCYSAVSWFPQCYFQGAAPTFEMVILVMAWNLVNDGKLDDDDAVPDAVPAAGSYRLPAATSHPYPAPARS